MELLRPDFLHYISAIRQSLAAIQTEQTSAKAIDDIDCIDRILCLFEAEHRFRAEHLGDAQKQIDTVLQLLQPALSQPALQGLADELANHNQRSWPTDDARIGACRMLLQRYIPALWTLADNGDISARDALQQLLRDESSQYQRIHSLREQFFPLPEKSGHASVSPAGTQLATATLQAYLRDSFPQEKSLRVVDVNNLPGGRSKETTLIELADVSSLPARIVMRSDIEGGLVPSKTADEYQVLKVVGRHADIPVPAMLYCETDKSRLGSSFLLMAAVDGRAQGAYNPDVRSRLQPPLAIDRARIGAQLARILAHLHRIPVAEFSATHLGQDAAARVSMQEQVRQTIDSTYAQATSFEYPSRLHIEMAYHWLHKNLHLADDELCLIHCDIGLHNMLIDDDQITALLDWELACLASPAREIAKILHLIDFLMPREMFFREYLDAGGAPNACEPQRLNFYAVMNYLVTNQRARYANHLFFKGPHSNIVLANAGYDSCYRVTSLLANALDAAQSNH